MEPIALVNCCLPPQIHKQLGAPQGALYLATALSEKGRPSSIFDTSLDLNPSDYTPDGLYEYLFDIPERIIGISLWDSVIPKVVLATRKLKIEQPEKIVILGGPSASTVGRSIIEHFPWIDYSVSGEGEVALDNLLSWIESTDHDIGKLPDKITGRFQGRIVTGKKKLRPLEPEKILLPDYCLVKAKNYERAEIITTRGCPHRCSFCSVNNTWGNRIRFRPLDHVFKEIELLLNQQDLGCIHILDDNFGTDKTRFSSFCNFFRSHHSTRKWSCYFRVADMDRKTVRLMANSGCCGLYVGIESGSERKLHELGKGIGTNEIIERIGYASARMKVTASFIWGFPGTTYEQFLHTLELVDRILDFENVFVNLYQLAPLSGTRILNEFNHNLVFDEEAVSGFIYPPFLSKLTANEKMMIGEHPGIFSAFYHEDSMQFESKYLAINKFLGD